MNRSILKLAIAAAVGTLISSNPIFAQKLPPAKKAEILPPAKKAARVTITRGPVLESASDYLTVIRWITTNPGGSDVHFGTADGLRGEVRRRVRLAGMWPPQALHPARH
jgi:hypothetical protein